MIIPIEVHELYDILSYEESAGNTYLILRNQIFEARPRLVHKHFTQYSTYSISGYKRVLSEGMFYHEELNRIPRDCGFFHNRNNGTDWTQFSKFDDL